MCGCVMCMDASVGVGGACYILLLLFLRRVEHIIIPFLPTTTTTTSGGYGGGSFSGKVEVFIFIHKHTYLR